MDILAGLAVQIDIFWYNILLNLAGLHWSLLRGFVMMGYTVELLNNFLTEHAFVPLIEGTNAGMRVAVSAAFVVALLVLGITYLLAVFVRVQVVHPRSAITWYLAGLLFFSLAPSLYRGMNDFRQSVGQGLYLSTMDGLQNTLEGTFDSLQQVNSTDLDIGPLCDNLGVYLPGVSAPGRLDGLDVALAYLRADGPDVMGYPQPVLSLGCPLHLVHPLTGDVLSQIPMEWNYGGSYFDAANSPMNFDIMDSTLRWQSLNMASSAQGRLLTAWPLVLFGVVEQLVYLLITIAQGITFLSFGMAILFAFFKKTESIARSIIDQWIELIVQTVVIAMVQGLVVTFFLAGTTSGSGMVVLGIGLICLVFMLIVFWSGIKAVWNSVNRLFGAMGQVTGGVMLSPGAVTVAGAAGAAVGGLAAAHVGSNALAGMMALSNGATAAQAAGMVLGDSTKLSGAARQLSYLPGLHGTPLAEAAEQFTEGASARRIAQNIPLGYVLTKGGASLLTDREGDERQMLNPAVGERLASWTTPRKSVPQLEDDVPRFHTRYGVFTPSAGELERAEHQADMRGEEMEQHLTDTLRGQTPVSLGQLISAGESLERTAQMLISGTMRVNGARDMAEVLGNVQMGGRMDFTDLSRAIGAAMGLKPVEAQMPVQQDIARFGLFLAQAHWLGLDGGQIKQVVTEVKESRDKKMKPETRENLIEQVRMTHNVSYDAAGKQVDRLQWAVNLLPNSITAQGQMEARHG